ncbi:24233_t:CDS:2 [Gigaspora rosea]|nr:24233_t:CDS:2 [Gigaspora rosea]
MINTLQDLIELIKIDAFEKENNRSDKQINDDSLDNKLNELIVEAERGKIKFSEINNTCILPTKINNQAIYSSRPLKELISKALPYKI